jgi:aryl-alcohol dehydrogenase-like predicted oxidoreductase
MATLPLPAYSDLGRGIPIVRRLGLATRGNSRLTAGDVEHAIARGLNYLNWCGRPDGLSRAVSRLGARRGEVAVAVQYEAGADFDALLDALGTTYIDIATLYYVESEKEWESIVAPGGAWDRLDEQKRRGRLRAIGLTTHQRKLAARWTATGRLDMLMVRYNAAHRGAERDVFAASATAGAPVVTFTSLRWKALLRPTPDDPPGYAPPSAADCYRFCLAHPSVAVALAAPGNRAELEQVLALVDDWRAPSADEIDAIRRHGDRVHRHASEFW